MPSRIVPESCTNDADSDGVPSAGSSRIRDNSTGPVSESSPGNPSVCRWDELVNQPYIDWAWHRLAHSSTTTASNAADFGPGAYTRNLIPDDCAGSSLNRLCGRNAARRSGIGGLMQAAQSAAGSLSHPTTDQAARSDCSSSDAGAYSKGGHGLRRIVAIVKFRPTLAVGRQSARPRRQRSGSPRWCRCSSNRVSRTRRSSIRSARETARSSRTGARSCG